MAACWPPSAVRSCTRVIMRSWTRSASRRSNSASRSAPPLCTMKSPSRAKCWAQRAQHFALLGRLAAGVSHEIRNPLGAVFLHVDLLAEELQRPSPDSPAVVAEALTEIKTQL